MINESKRIQNNRACEKYALTMEQATIYLWLRLQKLNIDDDTLHYWSRHYPGDRIRDIVNYAHARLFAGDPIKNIGGWISKLLKTESAAVNDSCIFNRKFAEGFVESRGWSALKIYEKYVKDEVTESDLPLTIAVDEFKRALNALYEKSQLYKGL
jgi:hypothetical protein